MVVLGDEVPYVVEQKIYGYFLDLCILHNKTLFKPCLKQIVFSNTSRTKEVQEEMSDAAASGDHGTLNEYLELGYTCYMNPFNSEYTSLDLAILFGHNECVRVILDHTSSLEGIELCGDGPVVLAIKYRRMNILRTLLKKGFNPWGTNHASSIHIIEYGSIYRAVDVYLGCGISLQASYLIHAGCIGILAYLMKKGFDPTQELFVEFGDKCNWMGSRKRLYKFIYVSCVSLNVGNWLALSKFTDHKESETGKELLQFNERNTKLLLLLEKIREMGDERFSFLWLQE